MSEKRLFATISTVGLDGKEIYVESPIRFSEDFSQQTGVEIFSEERGPSRGGGVDFFVRDALDYPKIMRLVSFFKEKAERWGFVLRNWWEDPS
jgi:hypothetical protein